MPRITLNIFIIHLNHHKIVRQKILTISHTIIEVPIFHLSSMSVGMTHLGILAPERFKVNLEVIFRWKW